MNHSGSLEARIGKLGLICDQVPLDKLTSPIAAVACFPMYMVANVHQWTSDKQFRVPVLDLPGFEAIREAFALGREESQFNLTREHRHVLSSLLQSRPSDLIVYEFALEVLADYLKIASPAVAQNLQVAIARMIVAVARASGEGVFGTGESVSPEERECIGQIAAKLDLSSSTEAAEVLASIK